MKLVKPSFEILEQNIGFITIPRDAEVNSEW